MHTSAQRSRVTGCLFAFTRATQTALPSMTHARIPVRPQQRVAYASGNRKDPSDVSRQRNRLRPRPAHMPERCSRAFVVPPNTRDGRSARWIGFESLDRDERSCIIGAHRKALRLNLPKIEMPGGCRSHPPRVILCGPLWICTWPCPLRAAAHRCSSPIRGRRRSRCWLKGG